MMGVVYVLEDGVYLSKEGGTLKVSRRAGREVLLQKPLVAVEEIVVMGNAVVTPSLIKHCAATGVGIHYVSHHGSYIAGLTRPLAKNALARRAQFQAHLDAAHKLRLARAFVQTKIANSMVLLRRNGATEWRLLEENLEEVRRAPNEDALRGVEGRSADIYYRGFAGLLPETFAMTDRNRRPPRDPINSLLSLAYTFLAKECETALQIAGLDPYVGYLHEIRYGRPSLALDLMEEFRSIVADSVVLSLVNNRRIRPDDFDDTQGFPALRQEAWPRFLSEWERRLAETIRHPLLGKKLSYRQIFLAQARILVKHLVGELPEYQGFRVR